MEGRKEAGRKEGRTVWGKEEERQGKGEMGKEGRMNSGQNGRRIQGGRKKTAMETDINELRNSILLLKELFRLCVTMETGTGQNYDAGTGLTSTDEHLRIERCHCTHPFSFRMHGKGQIFTSRQPSLDNGELNHLDEDA